MSLFAHQKIFDLATYIAVSGSSDTRISGLASQFGISVGGQKNLNQNPLFASYVGDKRSNDKINSNSIIQFIEERSSEIESLNQLYLIDQSKLSEENQLNYKLKEFGLKSSIGLSDFPTYFLMLNPKRLVNKNFLSSLDLSLIHI